MALAGAGLALLCATAAWAGGKSAWSEFRETAPGQPQAIGGYSSGCVLGAAALPNRGPGYRLMRPQRHRHFGHPELVRFIRRLGGQMTRAELQSLAVGDLGQPRGGPAPGGHASHQTGLDVDLWYSPPGPKHRSMVAKGKNAVSKHYSSRVGKVLKLASKSASVDRIFVNPVIKQALCKRTSGDRKWLRKLRAWWGHDEHFHVRLKCPKGSPECTPQAPLPRGDGCGELNWWLDARKAKARKAGVKRYAKRIRSKPELPRLCRALVAEDNRVQRGELVERGESVERDEGTR